MLRIEYYIAKSQGDDNYYYYTTVTIYYTTTITIDRTVPGVLFCSYRREKRKYPRYKKPAINRIGPGTPTTCFIRDNNGGERHLSSRAQSFQL